MSDDIIWSSGIRSLAGRITEAGRAGEIVFLQFSTPEEGALWVPVILDACNVQLQLYSDNSEFERVDITNDKLTPERVVEASGAESAREFLTDFAFEPIAVSFPDSSCVTESWMQFFRDLVHAQADLKPNTRRRSVIISSQFVDLDGIEHKATARLYRIWNPVSWEDTRLVIAQKLGWGESEAAKAWMVASYTGASNLEPHLVNRLCDARPSSIKQIVRNVCELAGDSGIRRRDERISDIDIDEFGRWWRVPEQLFGLWQKGEIAGATLERGIRMPLAAVPIASRGEVIKNRIWQEQLAGLLPLVMEIGKRANRLLDRVGGTQWRKRFAMDRRIDVERTYVSEVGPLLHFLRKSRPFNIPKIMYELLESLLVARNSLAHMEPIEKSDIQTIWDTYKRVRQHIS